MQTDKLTDANQGVDNIWDGSKANALRVGPEVPCKVCGEPLHDDVVGPVHGKVCYIKSPQGPMAHKLCPPHICICYLGTYKISIGSHIYLKTDIFNHYATASEIFYHKVRSLSTCPYVHVNLMI